MLFLPLRRIGYVYYYINISHIAQNCYKTLVINDEDSECLFNIINRVFLTLNFQDIVYN